ncbi:MAG: helix-turn-helix transcriptional regulator [Candidatus Obscuribacterales bacterium]|nr:helix-turn-helix transcriptional regulator [Candidatus Obscuribacterales bacterium]
MSKPKPTHLGQFLRNLREQRGYDSIQEYARQYQLPVSYVYYTEIESGKKKISLETSKELCEALDVDLISFYYHVLKDVLPQDIQDDFLSLVPLHKVTDPDELAAKANQIQQAYQNNQLSRLSSATSSMPEAGDTFFSKHPELHSLVASIYCVSCTTDVELEKVAKQIGITMPIEEIIDKFTNLGIIDVTEGKPRLIKKLYDIIVTNDQRALSNIVRTETDRLIENNDISWTASANEASCFYGIVGLTKEKQKEFRALLADLDAEFDSYHQKNSEAEPQLMTVIFSPAKQYMQS